LLADYGIVLWWPNGIGGDGDFNMQIRLKLRSPGAVFLHDMVMVPVAWMGAYWVRYNMGDIPDAALHRALLYLPFVIVTQTIIFRVFGLYRGVWRFASIPDLIRIGKAVAMGGLFVGLGLFLSTRLYGVPRSVLPLYSVLLFLLLCGPRFLYRSWKDSRQYERVGSRALIIGAGMAGEMLVRDLLRESDSEFVPVGFVDDDVSRRRREIHGVRVHGTAEKIPRLVERLKIDMVLIAVPSATDKEMRRFVDICEACNVAFLTLPSVKEVLSSRVTHSELRDVSIEDLLGRDPVNLEWKNISRRMGDKTILVTGGGGSIGSELCLQLARLPIKKLIVFDKSEFNLYCVESEISKRFAGLKFCPVLGDVTDEVAIEHVLRNFRPDIIFHAAAYKHVPLLQTQVREAAKNNVVGTKRVAEAAIRFNVSEFVLISTDKAVNPTNIMGTCKRAAEILCQTMNRTCATRFITVRFGNVLDSAGSVVPLFRQQIKSGGPVTVTHPNISRFFMTIPEACQLIMQAAAVGDGGEIFVLDMGTPIKISYLAEQMIRLSGKRLNEDIDIEYIGLRPGEKMYEELFHEQERLAPTEHTKLRLALSRNSDYKKIDEQLVKLEKACDIFDDEGILRVLSVLVPEYSRHNRIPENLIHIDRARANL